MTEYPRRLSPAEVSPEMRALIPDLVRRLLTGSHPELVILRQQADQAELAGLTLTGAGFYAYFNVPPDAPRIGPNRVMGGNVHMAVAGLDNGGCVLCVTDGRLDFLEGYTFEGAWPERPQILSFGEATPLEIRAST
jgi:hypothetical protein